MKMRDRAQLAPKESHATVTLILTPQGYKYFADTRVQTYTLQTYFANSHVVLRQCPVCLVANGLPNICTAARASGLTVARVTHSMTE